MNSINTTGIILTRVNYGEADRIITFLTPDHGKITAIAKGVRKAKSKLAGGVELFSVSEISYIKGKSDIDTLISTRLKIHYGNIVKDLERTEIAYEIIKITNKATEDDPEVGYFNLLQESFRSIDDNQIDPKLTKLWFSLQLLKLSGHVPDLALDINDDKLTSDKTYDFDIERMRFGVPAERQGNFNGDHIKFLRMCVGAQSPHLLQRVQGGDALANSVGGVIQAMLAGNIRL